MLNDKQIRFCQEYVIDCNATQAAIRAGFSSSTARQQGSKLLTKVDIQEEVKKEFAKIRQRNQITIDELVQYMTEAVRLDMGNLYENSGKLKSLDDIPPKTRSLITEILTEESPDKEKPTLKKVKVIDKLGAIEKLMKHLGGYEKDNTQKGNENPVVIFQLPDNGRSKSN